MYEYKESHEYDDIIDLPHPVSRRHPLMPASQRAAQFAPFAALEGYGDAVLETARLTDVRIELDEDKKAELDSKLQLVRDHLEEAWAIQITYFVPDIFKDGGTYCQVTEAIKKVDDLERILILQNGSLIKIDDIMEMESDHFDVLLNEK